MNHQKSICFNRGHGDIETAVVELVARVAPILPVKEQPGFARDIAEVIATRPSAMGNSMFLRQSLIRGGTATHEDVVEGLAAWITVLFDIGNLRHDRARAMDLRTTIPQEALDRLAAALSHSRNGCILAVPHAGSLDLLLATLADHGVNMGFVYSVSQNPSPMEQWLLEGRRGSHATPIVFARRNTGAAIAKILQEGGVVCMVVDVYPSLRFKGIPVRVHGGEFNYPPGPARYARSGTLVLPGYASTRDAEGFSINILDPVAPSEHGASVSIQDADLEFTQRLANQIARFTTERPGTFWLWHPIPNDPFLRMAQLQRPDLLNAVAPTPDDHEQVALAVEAIARP